MLDMKGHNILCISLYNQSNAVTLFVTGKLYTAVQ